jgi:hypothetical protein
MDGDVAAFAVSPTTLGDRVQSYIDEIDRDDLRAIRQIRACRALQEYAVTPIYPDLDCD